MKRLKPWAWIIGILLLVVAVPYVWGAIPPSAVVQPISFNHKLHLSKGLACSFCHQGLTWGTAPAGKPKTQVCKNCHNPAILLSQSPENKKEEQKLVTYLNDSKDPPWNLVHQLPDYVYFSHYRHVTLGKLECKTCHGDVAERTTPMPRPVQPLKMAWCRKCHEEKKATQDCNACHR